MTEKPRKPNRDEIQAAAGRVLADVIAPGLRILFCGINPGLYSGATGHHFARPGNRFWPVLHAAELTPRRLEPHEERELLVYGYGITNIVARATASAAELSSAELEAGGIILAEKVAQYRPHTLAVLGVSAYRMAFQRPKAQIGPQEETIGETALWVLPNPSGLNAHYQLPDLARLFRQLKEEAGQG